jgi:hypothetical protein
MWQRPMSVVKANAQPFQDRELRRCWLFTSSKDLLALPFSLLNFPASAPLFELAEQPPLPISQRAVQLGSALSGAARCHLVASLAECAGNEPKPAYSVYQVSVWR